jgi:hypothetical protein
MRNLGGHLQGAPTVARSAGQVFFIAATRHGLQVRTERTSWTPLVTPRFVCSDPALAARAGRLAVGCLQGTAIWAADFAATSAGNPSVTAMVNQGGTLGVGPAVSFYGAQAQLEVLGGEYILGRSYPANTYFRRLADPSGVYTQDAFYECAGQPAQTSAPPGGTSYLGCVAQHRRGNRLHVVGLTPDGEDLIRTPRQAHRGRIGLAALNIGRLLAAFTGPGGNTVVETLRYLHHPVHRRVVYRGAHGGAAITAGPTGYG